MTEHQAPSRRHAHHGY